MCVCVFELMQISLVHRALQAYFDGYLMKVSLVSALHFKHTVAVAGIAQCIVMSVEFVALWTLHRNAFN